MDVMEAERKKQLQNKLKFDREYTGNLLETLKDEETKAKDMLDEKTKLQNKLAIEKYDLDELKALYGE